MNVRYRVDLTEYERNELAKVLSGGKQPARKLKRAQILLATDAGLTDDAIVAGIGVSGSAVYRTKRHFVEGDLELALNENPRPGAARKLTGQRGSPSGGDCLLEPACGPCALDAGTAGG
jgi:hypothetical protein